MASSFRIKLKLAPKPTGHESAGSREARPSSSPSSSRAAAAKSSVVTASGKKKSKSAGRRDSSDGGISGKRSRAAYSSSPESHVQSSSPRESVGRASSVGSDEKEHGKESEDEDEDEDEDDDEDEDEDDDDDDDDDEDDESGAEEIDELEDSPPPASSSAANSSPPTAKSARKGKKMVGTDKSAQQVIMARSGRGGRVLAGAAAGAHRKKAGLDSAALSSPATRSGSSLAHGSVSPTAPRSGKKAAATEGTSKKRPSLLDDLPKPITEMTLAEIEALPPAKRRKGLKVRGISGPGRGWRKGLKMDQRPTYGKEGETTSRNMPAVPGTPSSFVSSSKHPRSSLARDALSKTGTPLRSESPYSRSSPAVGDDEGPEGSTSIRTAMTAVKKRMAEELAQQKKMKQQTKAAAAAAISAAQAGEARAVKAIVKGAPIVLPLNKVPGSFITVTPLDKSKKPVRKWERRGREVLSIGGRPWFAATWITPEERQFAPPGEPKAIASQALGAAAASHSSTPSVARPTETAKSVPITEVKASAHAPASISPTLQAGREVASATLLPPPRHVSGKGIASGTGIANSAPQAVTSPSRLVPGGDHGKTPTTKSAASSEVDPAKDWRGSSAAYTMANRGRT